MALRRDSVLSLSCSDSFDDTSSMLAQFSENSLAKAPSVRRRSRSLPSQCIETMRIASLGSAAIYSSKKVGSEKPSARLLIIELKVSPLAMRKPDHGPQIAAPHCSDKVLPVADSLCTAATMAPPSL